VIKRIQTRPGTHNEPTTVLHDGKLAANYGPVFGNGVIGGVYKVDLGETIELAEINVWSYDQNGKRGPQRYALFGSGATEDPGWDVEEAEELTPIIEVDTRQVDVERFLATRIRRSGERSLGSFRWLVWVVSPVTSINENTAYQEIEIKSHGSDPK
jgi:hypothetical protein